jgi:UDP-N-acetylmuramoyl-tripeptide--D-alanyl-D-alanine ligase
MSTRFESRTRRLVTAFLTLAWVVPLPTVESGTPAPLPGEGTAGALEYLAHEPNWPREFVFEPVTRKDLVEGIEAARAYYLNHQRPDGTFDYEYDVLRLQILEGDNQVRQAGALWGLAALCRERPTQATMNAVVRGLDAFFRLSAPLPGVGIAPVYPENATVQTGTVALVCLAIIDFARGHTENMTVAGRGLYDTWLSQYLTYLQELELANGSWSESVGVEDGKPSDQSSPYFDGECLLVYCRAARYMGRDDLIPRIERIAPLLLRRYTVDSWQREKDPESTKGFFQWGCMAFREYAEAGWADAPLFENAAMAMAWWMIHEHGVEERTRNTSYALEGLLCAHAIAGRKGDAPARDSVGEVCRNLLSRLGSWQIGIRMSRRNPHMATLNRKDARIHGGVLDRADGGTVRIDNVQHQLHAYLLALEELVPED